MSILISVRGWLASWRHHEREAYAESRGSATDEELEEAKNRRKFSPFATAGMPKGTVTGPTGTPTDFTADQKQPRTRLSFVTAPTCGATRCPDLSNLLGSFRNTGPGESAAT
jgi:hypothetical protein